MSNSTNSPLPGGTGFQPVRPTGKMPVPPGELLRLIQERAARLAPRTVRFMEVCGTHTMAMFRSGIRTMLPPSVKLLSGPGCPVCVTPMGMVDAALEVVRRPGVTLATFGDMVRVPGRASSLERAKAEGADVRMVYSPLDALKLAEAQPRSTVVFFAIGFETTTPAVAATVAYARDRGLANMLFLVANKVIPPAMEAILAGGEVKLDGFLCPGHVSVITGTAIYEPLAPGGRGGADGPAAVGPRLARGHGPSGRQRSVAPDRRRPLPPRRRHGPDHRARQVGRQGACP